MPSSAFLLNDPSSCSPLYVATLLGSERVFKVVLAAASCRTPPPTPIMIEPLVPFIELFSPNKTLNAGLSNCSRITRCPPPSLFLLALGAFSFLVTVEPRVNCSSADLQRRRHAHGSKSVHTHPPPTPVQPSLNSTSISSYLQSCYFKTGQPS